MTVETKILSIISEVLSVPVDSIKKKDKLADIVQDSIKLFELLICFEKELGEKISYSDIVYIESIEDVIKHAHKKGFHMRPEFVVKNTLA